MADTPQSDDHISELLKQLKLQRNQIEVLQHAVSEAERRELHARREAGFLRLPAHNARNIVEEQKPLFDFTRYILQTVAFAVAAASVAVHLYNREDGLTFFRVIGWIGFGAITSICAVMFWRLITLALELANIWLPSKGLLGNDAFRFLSAMIFSWLIAGFASNLWAATVAQIGQ